MMCVCRVSVQQQPITREFSMALIDNVILTAMRGSVVGRHDAALADCARVLTPLRPAAFAPLYGMLTDRFGVAWIIDSGTPSA